MHVTEHMHIPKRIGICWASSACKHLLKTFPLSKSKIKPLEQHPRMSFSQIQQSQDYELIARVSELFPVARILKFSKKEYLFVFWRTALLDFKSLVP